MANYPVKLLKDKNGTAFIPVVNSDSIITPEGNTLNDLLEEKQDLLTSGTNIKTINNESLLGSGNISIHGVSKYSLTELKALTDPTDDLFLSLKADIINRNPMVITYNKNIDSSTSISAEAVVLSTTVATVQNFGEVYVISFRKDIITHPGIIHTLEFIPQEEQLSVQEVLMIENEIVAAALPNPPILNLTLDSLESGDIVECAPNMKIRYSESDEWSTLEGVNTGDIFIKNASRGTSDPVGYIATKTRNFWYMVYAAVYYNSSGFFVSELTYMGSDPINPIYYVLKNSVRKDRLMEGANVSIEDDGSGWLTISANENESYGTCSSSGDASVKVIDIVRGNSLIESTVGNILRVRFDNALTCNNPKLRVRYGTRYDIYDRDTNNELQSGAWGAGDIVTFYWDGSAVRAIAGLRATTANYGETKLSSSVSSTSTTEAATSSAVRQAYNLANGKQDALVSGTNIKTINNQSLLGSGNITIESSSGASVWGSITGTLSSQTDLQTELSNKASKSFYSDTTINVGRKSNTTVGSHSTSEGIDTTASGEASHAEGYLTTASGNQSHAGGYLTTASGSSSHAEGYLTTASGFSSHAEGFLTTANGDYSHAEGGFNNSSSYLNNFKGTVVSLNSTDKTYEVSGLTRYSSSSSYGTNYIGLMYDKNENGGSSTYRIISEVYDTTTQNFTFTVSSFNSSIVVGDDFYLRIASDAMGKYSHTEGANNVAIGNYSHAEGLNNTVAEDSSHVEGSNNKVSSFNSHAEGNYTTVSASGSHAEGYDTFAAGYGAHAEGFESRAMGNYSHAENCGGLSSIIEGTVVSLDETNKTYEISGLTRYITVNSNYKNCVFTRNRQSERGNSAKIISESYDSTTENFTFTVSEFDTNFQVGDSFYIAMGCTAWGEGSHVNGLATIAKKSFQTAVGKFNDNKNNTLFEVGNGTSTARSNAFEVYSDGRAIVGADPTTAMGVATKQYVDNAISATDTGWVDLTPSTGTWSYLKCRRIGNIVYVRGYATSFSYSGTATVITTLPTQFRPADIIYVYGFLAGRRMSRWYITDAGNLGIDWAANISDGSVYTNNATWHEFNTTYMVD